MRKIGKKEMEDKFWLTNKAFSLAFGREAVAVSDAELSATTKMVDLTDKMRQTIGAYLLSQNTTDKARMRAVKFAIASIEAAIYSLIDLFSEERQEIILNEVLVSLGDMREKQAAIEKFKEEAREALKRKKREGGDEDVL